MRRLLTTMLAMTLLASATAAEPTADDRYQFNDYTLDLVAAKLAPPLPGGTLSCSAAIPSGVAGCWLERPVWVLGPLEVAVGLDIQGDVGALLSGSLDGSHVAPYGILAYYGEDTTIWAELRLPRLGNVPVLGASDVLRVGFTRKF